MNLEEKEVIYKLAPVDLNKLQARYNNRWHDVLTINFSTGFATIKYGEKGKSFRVMLDLITFGLKEKE